MNRICEVCGYAEDLHEVNDNFNHRFVASDLMIECEPKYSPVTSPPVESRTLEQDLASVLNKHSAENGSNTPDFILAEYLLSCLAAFNKAKKASNEWGGVGYLNVGTTDT